MSRHHNTHDDFELAGIATRLEQLEWQFTEAAIKRSITPISTTAPVTHGELMAAKDDIAKLTSELAKAVKKLQWIEEAVEVLTLEREGA